MKTKFDLISLRLMYQKDELDRLFDQYMIWREIHALEMTRREDRRADLEKKLDRRHDDPTFLTALEAHRRTDVKILASGSAIVQFGDKFLRLYRTLCETMKDQGLYEKVGK